MIEMFYNYFATTVATSHLWLLSTCNAAKVIEEWTFSISINLYLDTVASGYKGY